MFYIFLINSAHFCSITRPDEDPDHQGPLDDISRWKSYCRKQEDPDHEELHSFCLTPEEDSEYARIVAQVDSFWLDLVKKLNNDSVLARIKLMVGTYVIHLVYIII